MEVETRQSPERRVCIFSQRVIRPDVSRCSGFEFEDVVSELEDCTLVTAKWRKSQGLDSYRHRARRWMSKRSDIFQHMPSGVEKQPLSEDFDIFGCFVQKPVELLTLDSIPNWRERSKFAVCVLEEVWDTNLKDFAPLVRSLSKFDLVTSAFASVCEEMSRIIGRPVIHLPGAVDIKRFSPKATQERVIDVYYLGRKRSELHKKIMRMFGERDGFYLYDSATAMPIAADHVAHRELLASLVQQSKLFVVDYAKFGHADQASGQISWGPRYVEGMAGGAVQIGYAPDTDDFSKNFDWPEAVYRLPDDPVEATDAVAKLLDNPERLNHMRAANLAKVALKHDWMHRWELILDHFALPHTHEMARRRQDLQSISAGTYLCQTPDIAVDMLNIQT